MNEHILQVAKQLKDVDVPPDISIWPLAVGWYVLMVLIVLIFGFGIYYLLKIMYKRVVKRKALKTLERIRERFAENQSLNESTNAISILLRRLVLHYYPRSRVAGLFGLEWCRFIDNILDKNVFENTKLSDYLLVYPYGGCSEQAISDVQKDQMEACFNHVKQVISDIK